MIEAMRKDYSICELCETLGLSRSGFYAWTSRKVAPGPLAAQNGRIVAEIKAIHADRHMRCYGSPRMTAELIERGLPCGENRVARLMRQEGLQARARKPWPQRLRRPIQPLALHPIFWRRPLSRRAPESNS